MNELNGLDRKCQRDKLRFVRITNQDLVCRDCLYRYDDSVIWGNTSKCEMYETVKPSTVIDGGKCELYDKEESL